MFTARKELVFWHKTPSLTYWSELAFPFALKLKPTLFWSILFTIRKPTLSYGKWTLSWRCGKGWEHHRLGNTTFPYFHPSSNSPGAVSSEFFSAALRDRAQEATRRRCSGSTELFSLWAWPVRKENLIYLTNWVQLTEKEYSPTYHNSYHHWIPPETCKHLFCSSKLVFPVRNTVAHHA